MARIKNRSSLFIQYLLLFTLIAMVPVITTCSALLLSNRALKSEVTQSNLASLELVQQSMDTKYLELTNIQSVIEQNSSLTKSALINNPLEALSEIKSISLSYNSLSNMMIYVRDSGRFFASNGAFSQQDLKYQSFIGDLRTHGYSETDFIYAAEEVSAPEFWPKNCYNDYPSDIYLFTPIFNTVFRYEAQNSSRVAILQINRDYVHDLFRASQTNSDESILLMDSARNLISFYSPNTSTEALSYICDYLKETESLKDVDSLEIEGSNCLLFSSQSPKTGLIYIRFLPEAVALHTINQMRNTSCVILAIALLISVFLIWFGMKKSYFPIRSLADWINDKRPGSSEFRNELVMVKNVFEETLEQNSSMSELISDSRYGLIDRFLQDLICGRFDSQSSFNKTCKKLAITFDKEYFTVACLLFSSKASEQNDLQFEHILSIIRELCPDTVNLHVKDLLFSGKLLFVLNCDHDTLPLQQELLSSIKDEILSQAGVSSVVGVGMPYPSFEFVGKSYLEAINALDYRMIYGNESIISPEMCRVNNTELVYPSAEIADLYSSIVAKDLKAAVNVISKLREYVRSPHCTLHLAKYICYDSFASLKKCPAFISVAYYKKISGDLDITRLADFDNVDEFFTSFLRILEAMINASNSEDPKAVMAERIIDYIESNCFCYDFQISSIAEHFSVSQPSIRKLFSEYTGVGINDYITNIKIDRAAALLSDTDKTLQQIVEEIGNTDTSAFIRLFKKKTGMTPGQYRKNLQNHSV